MNVQIRILANQAQQRIQQLNMTINQLGNAWGGATAGANGFGNAINGMGLVAFGSRLQWVGRQLEYNFTIPLVAAAAASFKFALDNEAAFTRVTKVYGDATHGAQFYAAELKSLQGAFEALSNTFGVAQKDTVAIAADWAAAGASGLALAKSVKLTMETMILGELNATDATKALIAIQAQYGFSVDKLAETIATLNMVENQTGISMSGLIEGFARAAGVARSAGVDVRHLAAMLAALTPAAGSAAQAGNALKTIFSRLLSPTEETTDVLNLMGINVKDLSWQSANLVDRLAVLGQKFDGLSDSQKGVVSSVVASRWQINKFEILMRELTSTTGYYQKALDATADAQANFTQMQRELNTVLASNPRRLQIIWTMLQNASADIIQPMIPLLLYLAGTLAKLATWFSNLDPGLQKLILGGLALLAIIGPLTRYVGVLMILFGGLGRALAFIWAPLSLLSRGLWQLISIPIVLFFRTASIAALAFGRVLGVGLIAATRAAMLAMPALAVVWRAGLFALNMATVAFTVFTRTAWLAMATGLGTLAGAIWYRVVIPIWTAGLASLRAITVLGLGAVGAAWRATLLFLTAITSRAFWVGILGTISTFFTAGLLPLLRRAGATMIGALFGPWGIAIGLIVTLVITFWDQIVAVFNSGVRAVKAGFAKLPQSVQASLLSLLRTVAAVVIKIREWLSYLNPWARHSPSLVDNVTTGVAEIIRQFSTLSNVNAIFSSAGVAIGRFAEALFNARDMADKLQWQKIQDDISEFAPQLTGDFDALYAVLKSLRGELADLQHAWPIEAAKAMSDAIFDNEMAMKALQLQMMDLEDAAGPIDELQSKMESLNGMIELLNGERSSLRSAGAGSDILSQYDDQIGALEAQKAAIEAQIKPIKAVADQLDKLRRLADRLQLQESLQFDPIARQADELTSAIQQVESALNAMSQAASAAASASSGSLSPGAQNFLDAAGGDFPDVGGGDIIGREGGLEDQAALIDQFTADLAKASSDMFGSFDFLSPIKNAWNKAVEWMKSTFGPIWQALKDKFKEVFGDIPNPFANLDLDKLWNTIKDVVSTISSFFGTIWELIKDPVMQIVDLFKSLWQQIKDDLGPELAKFKDLLPPLVQLFKELWVILKPFLIVIGVLLVGAIVILVYVLANVLVPILHGVIEILAGFLRTLRGVLEFILGVFTGDWTLAWTGIKDFFSGIWNIIFGVVRTVLGLIWGLLSGAAAALDALWNKLWEEYLHVIGDAWNEITSTVSEAWHSVWNTIVSVGNSIGSFFSDLWGRVIGGLEGIWNSFQTFINRLISMPGQIANALSNMFAPLWNGFRNYVNMIIGGWNRLSFTIGGGTFMGIPVPSASFNTPDIGYLAAGGKLSADAMAIINEGRKGFPEFVIPTDPMHRQNALKLYGELGRKINARPEPEKVLARGSGVENNTRIIQINGNLEFPNITNADDVEEFIQNLEALMGEA